MKVFLSDTEDESASTLQNEETESVPVKLKNYREASGSLCEALEAN